MKTAELKRVFVLLAIIAMCLTLGFFIGRASIETKTITKLEKGETISGSVSPSQFTPIKEERPIHYRDTGRIEYIYLPTDTAAIIADWELKRTYKLIAFDNNTEGKLELFPVIQYNKLSGMDYNFTPIVKNNIIYKEKIWQPFVSGSYSTLNYVGIGGGVFYHNIGLEYQFQKSLVSQSNGHVFGLKYKF